MIGREWEEVDQAPPRRASQPRPAELALSLARQGNTSQTGESLLWLSLPEALRARLGWEDGMKLGVALGVGERTAGWLRIAPRPGGRPLRRLGRNSQTRICALRAPEALARLRRPRAAPEHRVAGDALLARIPWDLDEEEEATPHARTEEGTAA